MKTRNEKLEQLKDSILSIGLDYVNGGNSMDEEECPFCKSSNDYDHQHIKKNSMNNIEHDDDCPYILIQDIKDNESIDDLFESRDTLNIEIKKYGSLYLESIGNTSMLNQFNGFDTLSIDNEDEWNYYQGSDGIIISWEETGYSCNDRYTETMSFTIPYSFIEAIENGGDIEEEKENLRKYEEKLLELEKLVTFYDNEIKSFENKIKNIKNRIRILKSNYFELLGKEIDENEFLDNTLEIKEFEKKIEEFKSSRLSIKFEIIEIKKGKENG